MTRLRTASAEVASAEPCQGSRGYPPFLRVASGPTHNCTHNSAAAFPLRSPIGFEHGPTTGGHVAASRSGNLPRSLRPADARRVHLAQRAGQDRAAAGSPVVLVLLDHPQRNAASGQRADLLDGAHPRRIITTHTTSPTRDRPARHHHTFAPAQMQVQHCVPSRSDAAHVSHAALQSWHRAALSRVSCPSGGVFVPLVQRSKGGVVSR